jgi:hypothetical protein
MEKLITDYLNAYHNESTVKVDYFDIVCANCKVNYKLSEDNIYPATIDINVWDMLLFLKNQAK